MTHLPCDGCKDDCSNCEENKMIERVTLELLETELRETPKRVTPILELLGGSGMSAEKNNKTNQPPKEFLDELEVLNEARTQGIWQYGHFCEDGRDNEWAIHVVDAEGSEVLKDGSISKALTICIGMTGPNKINNSYAIAEIFNNLDRLIRMARKGLNGSKE